MNNEDQTLNECGCCEGIKTMTPVSVENRPGLQAIAYRVGTHGSFKESMQAAISSLPALRGLTTREDDDPTIALMDGWATVLDVLSFYQERIANEGFLRTATERRSILEMARSLGYELRPGVAAGTYLAFTLETAEGSPPSTTVPIGTKAQTTPGQDESPQVFETIEEIQAKGTWNELEPRQTQPYPPQFGLQTLYLKGTSTNLKPGDTVLVIGDERLQDPGNENWDFRHVTTVTAVPTTDPDSSYTVITLDEGLGSVMPHIEPATKNPKIYAMRLRASLFGYNAPDWKAMSNSLKAGYLGFDPNASNLNDLLKPYGEWPGFDIASISDPPPRTTPGTGLYGEYFDTMDFKDRKLARTDATVNFNWGTGSPDPSIGSDSFSIRWTGWIQPKADGTYTFYVLVDDGARLWVDGKLIIDQWKDQAATEYASVISLQLQAGEKYDIKLEYYEHTGSAQIQLSWSSDKFAKEVIPKSQLFPRDINDVHLDALYSQILTGSWVVLGIPEYKEVYRVTKTAEDARANFSLSAKTTRLTLQGEQLSELFNNRIRDTVVYAQSEELEWAERPITSPVSGYSVVLEEEVDDLSSGQLIAFSGADLNNNEAAEIVVLDRTELEDGHTKLVFKSSLNSSYQRSSVTINANVAKATHGETKQEVLGSGDASQAFQKFVLKQHPLTYVSAATSSGAKTTLEVRVNDVLWDEAPDLYHLGPNDREYITRIADDGKVTVQCGDGTTGARFSTGSENISAKYRVGIGLSGMVNAGQINLLMSRPLGTKGVINPLAPTGAQDPEQLDEARQNAPLTVLTLDRIVSLQDFEDFTRAFSGIGKAQAIWLWDGEKRLVHLTVAGVEGSAVPTNSDLYQNLSTAIDAARHADQQVRIDDYDSVTFDVQAQILCDSHYLFDDVKVAVEAALEEAFSFDNRSFGQAVTESEVIAVMQGVEGVVAVNLKALYFDGSSPSLTPTLPANVAHWQGNQILPAELLTINPDGIQITEMTL